MSRKPVALARSRRGSPIFACGKCLRRLKAGPEVRRALKSEAKSRGASTGLRPARVVRTACLGLCPKGAVVLASAATLASGTYVLLRDEDGVIDAVDRLLPEPA